MRSVSDHGRRSLATCLFAFVLTLAASAALSTTVLAQSENSLPKDLIGTWILEEAEVTGNPSGIGTRLKHFTGTHWMVTQPDSTGMVVFHHGGTYELRGDTLVTHTNFAGTSTHSFVGRDGYFRIFVEGDVHRQTGLDNPYNEVWRRAK